jgi:hypothetical protein
MPLDSINIESDVTRTLRAAWSLIDRQDKWAVNALHLRRSGRPDAYCSAGAIAAVAPYTTARPLNEACVHQLWLAARLGPSAATVRGDVKNYNDGLTTHAALHRWWMRAIKLSVESDAKALVEPAA